MTESTISVKGETMHNLFLILERMEKEIGNSCNVRVQKVDTALRFTIFWPDGFVYHHKFNALELDKISDEQVIVDTMIERSKKVHPQLVPFIS